MAMFAPDERLPSSATLWETRRGHAIALPLDSNQASVIVFVVLFFVIIIFIAFIVIAIAFVIAVVHLSFSVVLL